MHRSVIWALGFALVACGQNKRHEAGQDVEGESQPYVANGPGANTDRSHSGSGDGTPVSGRQPGAPGAPGAPGKPGTPGAPGPVGGLALYDADGVQIGVKLRDDVGNVAHVVLRDHTFVAVDKDTGDLMPRVDIFCLYEEHDCSGSCYVHDRAALNYVLEDVTGATLVAGRKALDLGPKTMRSYSALGNQCIENTIDTTSSYLAEPYAMPAGLSVPFSAPLDWDLAE
jgi:hypothetical protein